MQPTIDVAQLKKEVDNLPPSSGLKVMMEQMLNSLMQQERSLYLSNHHDTKGNGFYQRQVAWDTTPLTLSIPRDRDGEFRSAFLPDKYQRVYDESYDRLLHAFLTHGYSRETILSTLRALQLPYSEDALNQLTTTIHTEAQAFHTRRLPEQLFALFVDGYHCDLKDESDGRIKQAVIYVLLGITLQGTKDIIGWHPVFGGESSNTWKIIFHSLIDRGLKRIGIVISDDLAGIHEVISTLFPRTDHQLCMVHLQRNIHRQMHQKDAAMLNQQITQIKLTASTTDDAVDQFKRACDVYTEKYKGYMQTLMEKAQQFFACIEYPMQMRKYLYTTNCVENINSVIEKIRIRNGGYFQSTRIIDINLYLLRNRLTQGKWKHGVPKLKYYEYDILQLMNKKFM